MGTNKTLEVVETLLDLARKDTMDKNIIRYPIDKVTNATFKDSDKLLESMGAAKIITSKHKTDKGIYILLDLVQKDGGLIKLKQPATLTAYDQRVYIAVGNLYKEPNAKISMYDIYKIMQSSSSNANIKELDKINKSLEKMRYMTIYIDNANECEKYNYKRIKYNDTLLSYSQTYIESDGGTEYYIRLARQPILFEFAECRGQIENFVSCVFDTKLRSKNKYALEDYMLRRIAREKQSGSILFDTLLRNVPPRNRRDKYRILDNANKVMTAYKENGIILDFEIKKDKISFQKSPS